jgi:membrane protein YqaA with SNARE-associated domain
VTYLVMAAVVLGVNLLPAFGPPTWSVLILFRLHSHLNPVALVLIGALAAGTGRYLLAEACRRLRGRLSAKRAASLEAARTALTGNTRRSLIGLALFAFSPIPSSQLFVAAGLLDVAILPLVAIFFAGRLVSYSIYVAGASAASHTSAGRLVTSSFTSPVGVAIQFGLLLAVVLLARVDWTKHLHHGTSSER